MGYGNQQNKLIMKVKMIALLILFFPVFLYSQSTQRGRVFLINSNKAPLPGVEISAQGAAPTISDLNGNFTLFFPHSHYGVLIFIDKISKVGFELVNLSECKEWVASEYKMYNIIMCKKGYLEATKRKYYQIGEDRYKRKYIDKKRELDSLKNMNQIMESDYIKEIRANHNEYIKAKDKLDFYADIFSRINKDDLHGIDSVAITYLENDKVDSAIIAYERSNILEDFLEILKERDLIYENMATIAPILVKEVQLCIRDGNPFFLMLADKIIEKLLEYSPENEEYINLKEQIIAIINGKDEK